MAKWTAKIRKTNGDILYISTEAEYSSDAKTKILAWMENDPYMKTHEYLETKPYEESPAAFVL